MKPVWYEPQRLWVHGGQRGFWDVGIVHELIDNMLYHVPLKANVRSVVDVGAHVGLFTALLSRHCPQASFACVEPDPDNFELLRRNVGGFARTIQAACTYQPDPLFFPTRQHPNTGGGGLTPTADREAGQPVQAITLEEIMASCNFGELDVLKLDCEGSEFDILQSAECLDRVKLIVGEYHDRERFVELRMGKFLKGWRCDMLNTAGPLGNFLLYNRRF